jgi:hypothetical protein
METPMQRDTGLNRKLPHTAPGHSETSAEHSYCPHCDPEHRKPLPALLPSGICDKCAAYIKKNHSKIFEPGHVETPVEFLDKIYDPEHHFADGQDEGIINHSAEDFYSEVVLQQDEWFGNAMSEDRPELKAMASDGLLRILKWAVPSNPNNKDVFPLIGRKILSALWVLRPDHFDGSPSLAALARKIGFSPANLATHTADFSRQFNVLNGSQGHGKGRRGKFKPPNEKAAQDGKSSAADTNKQQFQQRADIQYGVFSDVPACPGLRFRLNDDGTIELTHPSNFGTRVIFSKSQVTALALVFQAATKERVYR